MGLLTRGYRLCSSYISTHGEFRFLRECFIDNGYPASIVDSCIMRFLNRQFSTACKAPTVPRARVSLVLPFTGEHGDRVRSKILRFLTPVFPQISFRVVFQPQTRLASLFRFKDGIPKCMRSGVVYQFKCSSCNASYIGQTSRHYHIRVSEHLGLSSLTGMALKCRSHSSIFDHHLQTGHNIGATDFRILASSQLEADLLAREAILISHKKPPLNGQTDFSHLMLF